MRRLVVVHQKERLVIFANFVEPVQRDVGDCIGAVHAFFLDRILWPGLVALDSELGIKVLALAGQHAVVVERGWLGFQMPFADHGSLVTGLLHLFGEMLILGFNSATQIKNTVGVVVLSGHDASTTGGADRVGAERVLEQHAFLGQTIEVRRWVQIGKPTSIRTNRLAGVIIRHDEQDIGSIIGDHPGCHRNGNHPNQCT